MKLTLAHTVQEAPDVKSFIWQAPEPVEFKAGQYGVYKLPQNHPDDRGVERFFTISAAPHEGHLRTTTRFADKGSTFKQTLHGFKLGDEIELDRVGGNFVIEDPTQDYVFIAGGIGITPFRSILLDLDHRRQPINVTILYSNRDHNIVFKNELDALAAKYPSLKIQYFIDPEKIDKATILSVTQHIRPIFMISGPEPMVRAYHEMLLGMGAPPDHIKRDMFPGYDWP